VNDCLDGVGIAFEDLAAVKDEDLHGLEGMAEVA
jgi:hypothetical protein